jgi:hypothetical protein
MAFCNSCGAALNPGTNFCNKCGAAVAAPASIPAATPTAAAPAMPAPPPPPKGGNSALKIILISVAVIIVIGVLAVASLSFFVYHVAKNSKVHQEGDNVKVETPFGTVETSQDPEKVTKDLGVDIYPGAEAQKNGTSSVSFGAVHTVTATFTSSDSLDKVCTFYKSKFPNAMTTTSDQSRCTIVSNDQKNMITINIEGSGEATRIQITNVSKKAN